MAMAASLQASAFSAQALSHHPPRKERISPALQELSTAKVVVIEEWEKKDKKSGSLTAADRKSMDQTVASGGMPEDVSNLCHYLFLVRVPYDQACCTMRLQYFEMIIASSPPNWLKLR